MHDIPRFTVPIDADEGAEEVLLLPEASGHDWARIFAHARPFRFFEGDALMRAGESDRSLMLLVDGTVRVHGSGRAFKSIEAPSVLGEIAFLDGGTRSVSLVAETDGELVRFGMDSFEALSDEDPDLARRLALDLGRIAAVRLRLLTDRTAP